MADNDKSVTLTFDIYPETSYVGYLEGYMNRMIFCPPNRQYDYRTINKPSWIKYLKMPNSRSITYFSLDPKTEDNVDSRYILWSHGNGGDLLSHYPVMKRWFEAMGKKIGIIVYDYEGYGMSDGVCSEKNCYNDLTFMVSHVLNELHIKQKNLYLVGQSLGTGIVVDFCSRHRWMTPIILISPYKSISRVMVDPHWLDVVSNVVVNTLDMFTTHHKLPQVRCPIIIYHGLRDKLILPHHSVEMYNNHRDKITLVLLKNADHNNILDYINLEQISDVILRTSQ